MSEVNQQLAAILERMGKLLEILDVDRFRVLSFSKAARVLESLDDDLAGIGPDETRLQKLEGIGKGMAARIAEFLRSGKIEEYDQLLSKIPPGLPALLDIQGLGPKTVALLWKQGGVEDIKSLQQKLQGEELANLPGLGAKKLQSLRKNLEFAQTAQQRFRINTALVMARWIIEYLRENTQGIEQIDYAGSLRRGRETIGDIDIIVAAPESAHSAITQAFKDMEPVGEVLVSGSTKTSVRLTNLMQADLRLVTADQFGAALMYFTGSKEHNVRLRERAQRMGMTLNEYGLADRDQTDHILASATEAEIYEKLKVRWIPPELREDRGEIDLAANDQLPKLVRVEDIRAELHAHTQASDGRLTLRDLAMLAIDHGYHTLAVTDHSRSQVQAHGLDERRLMRHVEEIRKLAQELRPRLQLLAGCEVDILADGKLDYPNSVLKELDFIVASPHAALSQDGKTATNRLLKAIANPYVNVIGHPTGRLLTRREGLNPDMKTVLKAAAERGVAMEINASPWRLDLRDHHARTAIELGVKLSINTDAHDSGDLKNLYFGVQTARRAGAGPQHIINCMSREELFAWIQATRS